MADMSPTGTRKTSHAWMYFTDSEGSTARCSFCSKIISYKGGSTYNLTRHLRLKHHIVNIGLRQDRIKRSEPADVNYDVNNRSTQHTNNPVIVTLYTDANESQNAMTCSSSTVMEKPYMHTATNFPQQLSHVDEIDLILVEALVKSYIPFDVIENPYFKKFITALNSTYRIPNRRIISNDLVPELFNMTREKIRISLSSANSFSVTIDGWRSLADENYLTVTAHYINDEMHLKSWLLECFKYEGETAAKDLSSELLRIITEWGIDGKVEAIISKDASDIVAAVTLIGCRYIMCFAYSLNLCIHNAMLEVEDLYTKIKTIVQFFKQNPQAKEKLNEMQVQLGQVPLNIKKEITTYCNSIYDMLNRIVEIKDALLSTIDTFYPELENITEEEVLVMVEICELLKVFKDSTEEMGSEKQATVSEILVLSQGLQSWCAEFLNKTTISEKVKILSERLLNELKARFQLQEDPVFAEATLLDPRFKRYGFTDVTSFEKVKQTLISQLSKTSGGDAASSQTTCNDNSSGIWEKFDSRVSNLLKKSENSIEIDQYLQEPLLQRKKDPFQWWYDRKAVYPRLYEIAKTRLCIVGTSVSPEIIFSKAGHSITEKRRRLLGTKVPEILFLNENL